MKTATLVSIIDKILTIALWFIKEVDQKEVDDEVEKIKADPVAWLNDRYGERVQSSADDE